MDGNTRRKVLYRLMAFIKPRWPVYVLGLVGISFFNLAFNYMAASGLSLLTDASVMRDMNGMLYSVAFMGAGFAVLMVIMPVLLYSFNWVVKKTTGDIRKTFFDHVQKLPVNCIEGSHSGDYISRLTNDVMAAEKAYGEQISMLFASIVSGIGSGIYIFKLSPLLGFLIIIFGTLAVLINSLFIKPLESVSKKSQESLSGLTQKLSDLIAGSQVSRMFGITKNIMGKYNLSNDDIRCWNLKRVMLNSYLGGINTVFEFMSFIGLTTIGCIMVIRGSLTFGTVIAVVQMSNGLAWMFGSVGNYITQIQSSLAGAGRIFDILDISLEDTVIIENKDNSKVYKKADGSPSSIIQFKNVEFSYDGESKVLNKLNLRICKDQFTAVVGSSGGGKSTLYKILLGFYSPDSGSVNIMGRSVTDYELDELRNLFAYVPQDNYLFSGSIEENISYGRPGASVEQIVECAKSAGAYDFIMEFPDGFDTEVGERGTRLSGGQRQRIAIARALLKDAPILLLDEATSSLDSESEMQVQKALEVLMKGRTTIVIAHRLSTIQNADRILVLDDGIVCEEGDHDSLLALGKNYARLYNLQFRTAFGGDTL